MCGVAAGLPFLAAQLRLPHLDVFLPKWMIMATQSVAKAHTAIHIHVNASAQVNVPPRGTEVVANLRLVTAELAGRTSNNTAGLTLSHHAPHGSYGPGIARLYQAFNAAAAR